MTFRITKIRLPDQPAIWCLVIGDVKTVRDLTLAHARFANSNASLFLDSDQTLILKAPRMRNRWLDNGAKLFLQTPADRETKGSRLLSKLGLKTPRLLARAIPLNPWCPYRSLLWCRYIKDAPTLSDYLKEQPHSALRSELIQAVARQLRTLLQAGVQFRDFYFGNLLLTPDHEIHWIDTEVKHYPWRKHKAAAHFLRKEDYMYQRFLRHGGHADEWPAFITTLFPDRQNSHRDQLAG